ncbi:PREDICTED: ERO1-like protein beta [Priapulus caudatus]|uniref:ERO1-like protein beta n=1 Tax=Priapulus caudatus TaxID=37621 RepID=A0ABM1EWF4_PRICU|nr:PREDICTED: ERO1-like protein beta [Priapulus caudatus]
MKSFHVHQALSILVMSVLLKCNCHVGRSDDLLSCFCQLVGQVDDCGCDINTVDHFNNARIWPLLQPLLNRDYFRFFKVNLNNGCPFWPDDSQCSIEACSVDACKDEDVPGGLLQNGNGQGNQYKYSAEAQESSEACVGSPESGQPACTGSQPGRVVEQEGRKMTEKPACAEEEGKELGALDPTISKETLEAIQTWKQFDDAQDMFCQIDDETSGEYVDLLLNPERYTGYRGASALRIWRTIYEENCFKPKPGYGDYITSRTVGDLCLEKRAFFRAVSGLHASINIHLCADYLFPGLGQLTPPKWGPNPEEFRRRFDPVFTDGEGPQRLKNLYFVYLLELRALAKAAPYFESEDFYSGDSVEDAEVTQIVSQLLNIVRSFPNNFDESVMFQGDVEVARKLKEEFRLHFLNISRIMDCVGCDKCRLWGKLQVGCGGQAAGGLWGSSCRLSESMQAVERFRKLVR